MAETKIEWAEENDKNDWEEEQFSDHFDPDNDCPRCRGSGQVTTESYESYFGDNYKTCPDCGGSGD